MFKQLKTAAILGSAFVLIGLSAQEAQAQYSCSDATYGSGSGTYNSTYSSCSANNTANQASTVSTSVAVLKTAAAQSASLISSRVAAAVGTDSGFAMSANSFSASTGMAAGGHTSNIAAWVSGSWSDLEDDNTDTKFDGNVYTAMVGADYQIAPATVVGIAIGYEDVDIDTEYNGFGGVDGSLEGDGYTIAPYIGTDLGHGATATLTIGYSDLEYDTTRYDPNTGNRITGSTDADRYFVDASVNGQHQIDQYWRVRGKASVFYASEDKDGFTETESNGSTITQDDEDNDFGQISAQAKIGYLYQQFEPYALVGVEYDFTKDEAAVATGQNKASLDDEDFGAKFGAGVDFQFSPTVTGGVEAYTVEFRDDYSEYTLTGGLRVKF